MTAKSILSVSYPEKPTALVDADLGTGLAAEHVHGRASSTGPWSFPAGSPIVPNRSVPPDILHDS
jgi:hypothetical protein